MGIKLIKIAVVYFLIGISLGLYMSVTHKFVLSTVHVHMNLLGWVSLAIAGILYLLFPHLPLTSAAKAHFWLHNIGLPLMMIGLIFVVYGNHAFIPVTAIGGTLIVIAVIIFTINVLQHLKE